MIEVFKRRTHAGRPTISAECDRCGRIDARFLKSEPHAEAQARAAIVDAFRRGCNPRHPDHPCLLDLMKEAAP